MSDTTDLKKQWDENKTRWEQLCTEQESLPRDGFAQVFEVLDKLEETFTPQHPYTTNEALIDEALKQTGHFTNEAFCTAFKRNNQIMIEGNRLMMENAQLNLQIEMMKQNERPERVSPEGWRFYPIHIIAPQQYHTPICEELQRQASQGDGIFKNFTEIAERPDEALDMFLGVEVYNVKCNFQLFLSKLQKYRVTGGTLGKEFTHNLFDILNEIANYIKNNTDKPQGVRGHILGIVEALDNVPIWGRIFQILILQGLISLLENCTLNEGDNGFNEAQDLCNWLGELLSDKVCWFAMTGAVYSDEDWERLQPLCDFLYNTDIGRAVQDCIFKDEATDEEQPDTPEANTTTDTLNLPSELDTDRAREYFTRAVEVGYMTANGTTTQWLSAVARLGYMCYKIYSQPRPIASLEKYFGVTKLSAAITQASYEAKRADVKKWRAEIDSKIFFD